MKRKHCCCGSRYSLDAVFFAAISRVKAPLPAAVVLSGKYLSASVTVAVPRSASPSKIGRKWRSLELAFREATAKGKRAIGVAFVYSGVRRVTVNESIASFLKLTRAAEQFDRHYGIPLWRTVHLSRL